VTPETEGPASDRGSTLRDEVYACDFCVVNRKRFAKDFQLRADGRPKKFPPTIGATGESRLLFIAQNPRLTDNYVLDWAMTSKQEFSSLAANKDQYSRDYLRSYGLDDDKPKEDFYRPFIEIATSAYPSKSFDQVAAISDLYLCATPPNDRNDSTKRLAFTPNSPCADLYFKRVIAQVRPIAIITKGNLPMHYFRKLVGTRCEYFTAYPIEIEGLKTTLLPLTWTALDGTVREPHRTWLLRKISELDPAAVNAK
jgi:hypothetical protein